jgi:hypothetical protein
VVFVAIRIPLVLTAGFPTSDHMGTKTETPSCMGTKTETLVVDGTEVPVGSVRGFRAARTGAFVIRWLSYSRGRPSAPRIVVVPTESFESVSQLIDRVSDSTEGVVDDRPAGADHRESVRTLRDRSPPEAYSAWGTASASLSAVSFDMPATSVHSPPMAVEMVFY